jgi:serine/threonine protein phosphatase PrpC
MNPALSDTALEQPQLSFEDTFFAEDDVELALTFGAGSHVGLVRSRNEDQFAILRFLRLTEIITAGVALQDLAGPSSSSHSLVVADGMGGRNAGDQASRLAIATMVHLAGQASSWVMRLVDANAQQITQRVNAYANRLHAILQQTAADDPALRGMGTTWTSAHLMGSQCVISQIGDSRAYLLRAGRLLQITRDQTMEQTLIDAGVDPAQAARYQHVLVNSLGTELESVFVALHHLPLEPGDQLLLCTDGLTNMVSDTVIAAELTRQPTPQAACDQLIELALAAGGRDNITVVVAAVGEAQSSAPQVSKT